MNVSFVSNVNISGDSVFIANGSVSELELGLEQLITRTIQGRLDDGSINVSGGLPLA